MSQPQEAPIRISVWYHNRRHVLSKARADGGGLSLFAPTKVDVPMGRPVTLDISFGDSDAQFHLTGKVSFRRAAIQGLNFESGLGVSFEGEQKRMASEMIAICAGRPAESGTAHSQRSPVTVPCLVRSQGRSVTAEVRDLSSSGAFVALNARAKIREGEKLVLQLRPFFAGFGGQRLTARVVWVGSKQGSVGFGACFVDEAQMVRPVVNRFLAK